MVGIIVTHICASQPKPIRVMKKEMRDPTSIPPGNHMWNLASIFCIFKPEYMSAIIGLQAASVHPLPMPIRSVEMSKVVYPPAKMVVKIPMVWHTKATIIIFLGPNV
jgi:hypothetical protein